MGGLLGRRERERAREEKVQGRMSASQIEKQKPSLRRRIQLPQRRGRPPKPFLDDEDRYEVAFLEMWMRTEINGRLPSRRQAAQWAVLLKDFDLALPPRFLPAAQPQPAPTGHRNSPIKPGLKENFNEDTYSHRTMRAAGAAFDAAVKRLESKHRKWMASDTPEGAWIDCMADAWQAATYPQVMRDMGLNPERVCLQASTNARELGFAVTYLLPLLRAQQASARKRLCISIS
jgi:hypothetical protein